MNLWCRSYIFFTFIKNIYSRLTVRVTLLVKNNQKWRWITICPSLSTCRQKNEPKTIYRTSKTKTIYLDTDTAIYFNLISRKPLHHIPKYVILCKKLCDFLQTLNWRNCCALWSTELKTLGNIFMKSHTNFPYFVSKGPSLYYVST